MEKEGKICIEVKKFEQEILTPFFETKKGQGILAIMEFIKKSGGKNETS